MLNTAECLRCYVYVSCTSFNYLIEFLGIWCLKYWILSRCEWISIVFGLSTWLSFIESGAFSKCD